MKMNMQGVSGEVMSIVAECYCLVLRILYECRMEGLCLSIPISDVQKHCLDFDEIWSWASTLKIIKQI
jgi:hypothetical protein